MAFKMMDTPRTIRVYNLSSDTREFIGAGDAFIPEHTGLPANCTDRAPPKVAEGFVAVFDVRTGKWSAVEDHRGMTVFDIQTGQPVAVYALGALPENTVTVAPDGHFKKWNGKAWLPDGEAERKSQTEAAARLKADLLAEAANTIAPLQDAADLGMETENESAQLLAWKKYRVLLNRVDTSTAPVIDWPQTPVTV